jgi:hypothetical protein
MKSLSNAFRNTFRHKFVLWAIPLIVLLLVGSMAAFGVTTHSFAATTNGACAHPYTTVAGETANGIATIYNAANPADGFTGYQGDAIAQANGIASADTVIPANTDICIPGDPALAFHPKHASAQTATPSQYANELDSTREDQFVPPVSTANWASWSYSACSAFALTSVMNGYFRAEGYGQHHIAGDALQKEADLGVWNVDLGLLQDNGIDMAAQSFGYTNMFAKSNPGSYHFLSFDAIMAVATAGSPVIVGIRDSGEFSTGHILVVIGADASNVYLSDSSVQHHVSWSHSQFVSEWAGDNNYSVVLKPNSDI